MYITHICVNVCVCVFNELDHRHTQKGTDQTKYQSQVYLNPKSKHLLLWVEEEVVAIG